MENTIRWHGRKTYSEIKKHPLFGEQKEYHLYYEDANEPEENYEEAVYSLGKYEDLEDTVGGCFERFIEGVKNTTPMHEQTKKSADIIDILLDSVNEDLLKMNTDMSLEDLKNECEYVKKDVDAFNYILSLLHLHYYNPNYTDEGYCLQCRDFNECKDGSYFWYIKHRLFDYLKKNKIDIETIGANKYGNY